MDVLSSLPGLVMLLVLLVAMGVKIFAFVSALTFSEEAYSATAKLTKVTWCAILGLAVLAQLVFTSPLGLLNLVGIVAALVFLADVRPALRSVSRR